MPSLKDIRNRIGSVKNTKKITSAMKLVAAAKMRRAQEAVESARPYASKMVEVIEELVGRVDEDAHPLLQTPEDQSHALVILITSSRGLCGGFNANLLRKLDRFIDDRLEVYDSMHFLTIGRKGYQHVNKREDVEVLENYEGINGNVSFAGAKEVAQRAMSMFTEGEVDTVYLVFNEFISAIQTEQNLRQLLPLSGEGVEGGEAKAGEAEGGEEYIYEPSEAALLAQLLPNSVEVQVFQALLESEAAEHASRMTAMDNATSNAEEMIDSLTLQYNRARQAYITKELVEIVSGAESLKG